MPADRAPTRGISPSRPPPSPACCGRIPDCRLVLFRDPEGAPVMDIDEFAAFADLGEQIEWRHMVPLDRLPEEMARFDVNLVPLEVGNPFCEAKSDLKFFEAALAGACTIASPTGPFRRVIRDGENGVLAASEAAVGGGAAGTRGRCRPARAARPRRAARRAARLRPAELRRADGLAAGSDRGRTPRGAGLRAGSLPRPRRRVRARSTCRHARSRSPPISSAPPR